MKSRSYRAPGRLVARKGRKARKKGRIVHAPVGEAGVLAAASAAGIQLPRKFGL